MYPDGDGAYTLEHPADLKHGDYSTNVAMVFFAALRKDSKKSTGSDNIQISGTYKAGQFEWKSPRECAESIVEKMKEKQPWYVQTIEVAGAGFINFHLSKEFFIQETAKILSQKNLFGKTQQFSNQTWAIEYASPNPNKAMHLGHLRNVLTGVSLCRILEANGATVIREMVDNNRGIAIAKLMWGYLVSARKDGTRVTDISYWSEHQDEWLTPEDMHVRSDRFVDELYVQGATEAENSETEKEVRDLVVRWENKDAVVWKLWEKVLSYAYAGQKETLARLGATFDYVWHEHEHYQKGKDFVTKGLSEGVFKQLPDGAVITDLSAYNLSDTVVVKKDGTALYLTQDLALTDLKKKKHAADKMIWIIGPEQSLAMQQLFAICEQLGIGKKQEFLHVTYGYMSIKGEGKMSSRKGNVMYLDDVIDEAKEKTQLIMQDRIPAEQLSETAEMIAHSAIAFGILKAGRLTDMAFDLNDALRLEGDTGPYLEYSAVRAASLVQKAKKEGFGEYTFSPVDAYLTSSLERNLYRFPEVVERAGAELMPSTIANYLIEIAANFNSFYGNQQIIDPSDKETSLYRVALTEAFRTVMENGLDLLGIRVPTRM